MIDCLFFLKQFCRLSYFYLGLSMLDDFVNIQGHNIHFILNGRTDGPAFVFLHGARFTVGQLYDGPHHLLKQRRQVKGRGERPAHANHLFQAGKPAVKGRGLAHFKYLTVIQSQWNGYQY